MNSQINTQQPTTSTNAGAAYLASQDINDLYRCKYEDFQLCLKSNDSSFRASIWDNPNFKPQSVDYCNGLLDTCAKIRLRVWGRPHFQPTIVDVEVGLQDKDEEVRQRAVRRSNGNLTENQIKRALKDPCWRIRSTVWEFTTWKPTDSQIKTALADEDPHIRRKAIRRSDVELTPAREALALDLSKVDGDDELLQHYRNGLLEEIALKKSDQKNNDLTT